ncbi:MAG TPA: lasso peptide isopeptide bond-forming cyclase [Coleofasciculaceae cyanobacterium]
MSGILGMHALDGRPVARQDIVKMSDALAHRGPDGADVWVEGSIGLGHRMLWTTPESLLEKLPLVHHTGNFVITADARIDNRDELALVLALPNRSLEKITDSEFILAAYEKWGEQCPEHLLGDFAFAIWDVQQRSLFCARDHLGVKPFYYFQSEQQFLFASEMKALLGLPQVPCRLNEVRVADYLSLMFEDKVMTTYEGILRLPPAHSLSIRPSGMRLWSYWQLDPHREIRLESDEAYAEAFRKIFTEAVRCRLRSAFPIGSHLSGGIDSSSIVCVARQLLAKARKPLLHTFSNIFDNIPECDERSFINAVLEQGELIPHYVHADQFGPLSDVEQVWQYEEEAFLGPSHAYYWHLSSAAHQAGVRIIFDGYDGDTTVCHGFERLTELANQGQWSTFWQEAKGVARNFNTTPHALLRGYGLPQLPKLLQRGRWIAFTQNVRNIRRYCNVGFRTLILKYSLRPLVTSLWRRLRGQDHPKNSLDPLINPQFAQRINLDQRLCRLSPPQSLQTVKEAHWQGLTQGVIPLVLEQLDRYATAFSLEVRHPFLDKRLIEFCLALPADQKLSHGWSRMVIRRALANVLPEQVQWRGGKADGTANFQHGLLTLNQAKVEKVMLHELGRIEAYVDTKFLKEIYQRLIAGGNVRDEDCIILWRAIALALWLQHHPVAL